MATPASPGKEIFYNVPSGCCLKKCFHPQGVVCTTEQENCIGVMLTSLLGSAAEEDDTSTSSAAAEEDDASTSLAAAEEDDASSIPGGDTAFTQILSGREKSCKKADNEECPELVHVDSDDDESEHSSDEYSNEDDNFNCIHKVCGEATIGKGIVSRIVCTLEDSSEASEPSTAPRKKRKRDSASRDKFAVAAELLMLDSQCRCSVNCGFALRSQVEDIVQRVIDARFSLQTINRTKQTAALFNKLLPSTRPGPSIGDKHQINFVFAGIPICNQIWCKLHGLSVNDSRIKKVLASLRRGEQAWTGNKTEQQKKRGWRGSLCKAWIRRHIKKQADFDPTKLTASLDPDALEVRHMLYETEWRRRVSGARAAEPIKRARFAELWTEVCKEGYTEAGETYKVCIRPPRSGFTCTVCQTLMDQRKKATSSAVKEDITFQLNQHLQQAREARESYADNILRCELNSNVASIAIDAADQSNHRCPKPAFTCRANSKIKKIIQQFVGVLDHSVGYCVFRRLPYVQKGANLTLTLLMELVRRGHLSRKSELFVQWDGASENVAKTNLRFFIWLLLMCNSKSLPLQTITICRFIVLFLHLLYMYI